MGNFFQDVIQGDPRFNSVDGVNDLALLEPATRAAVQAIVADAAAQGMPLIVFETYRSQARQAALYAKGVSKLQKVGVHHYGLACDLVKNVNGQPSWNGDFSLIGQLAKKHQLIWGGDWGRPDLQHSFRDYPHVQRCSLGDQNKLFAGQWYPDANYNPYGASGNLAASAAAAGGSTSAPAIYRLATPLMSGATVQAIQQALAAAGFSPGTVDGTFGPQTRTAVIQFQNSKNLKADGVVGPTTAAALGIQL